MAVYEVQAPDGSILEIEGPDDATEDQIAAFAASQFGGGNRQPPPDSTKTGEADPIMQRLGGGIVETGYLAPKQLGARAFSLAMPENAAEVDREVAAFQAEQERGAPQGIDAARFSGNALGMLPSALGGASVPRAALAGATSGFVQTPGDFKQRAVAGAAGGAMAPVGMKLAQGVSQVVKPAGGRLTEAQIAAQREGAKLGFRQTPGYATGNKALQRVEAAMESTPILSGAIDSVKDHNARNFGRIAAKAIGEDADEISTAVLARAEHRIGNEFEKIATPKPVAMDPRDVQQKLMDVIDKYQGQYANPGDVSSNQLFKLMDNFGLRGEATQEQLVRLSSNLGKAIKNQKDNAMRGALSDVKEIADDALASSLGPQELTNFNQARQQYRALMQVTRTPNIVNPNTGDISGRNLARNLQATDRRGYLYGKNQSDLYNAARFVQSAKEIVGDSGTATRSFGAWDIPFAIAARPFAEVYARAPGQMAAKGALAGSDLSRKILADTLRGGSIPASTAQAALLAQMLMEAQ